MRRIALFSDVHGNLPALDAVLGDIAATGIAERYCLGDLVGYGPDPGGVVERVRTAGIPTVRGNYDDGVGNRRGSCGCYYATAEARANGDISYAFTDSALDDADHAWLAALPDELRLEHEGARILLAHGSPRMINEYLLPDRTDDFLARLAGCAGQDLLARCEEIGLESSVSRWSLGREVGDAVRVRHVAMRGTDGDREVGIAGVESQRLLGFADRCVDDPEIALHHLAGSGRGGECSGEREGN